ncbi:MAG: c-type cytochrome [Gammaproteobacteria bacterium]|nr:c-type cytochrome [Pseudomonadales bacterium]MCP5348198.1 c-type cytochrome [Pseudomonadales bacterium]
MTAVVTLAASVLGNLASGQDVGLPAPMDDKYCMTCHGAVGQGNVGVQAPRIAGMESWYLKRQLENFRAGIRGTHPDDEQGLAMQPMAARLTDQSIGDLIEWVGSFDYIPTTATIEGDASRGRQAYTRCASCHGDQGQGNETFGAPALAGQNDWYLVTQLRNFKAGYRGNSPNDQYGAMMVSMANSLTNDQAILNVVSYINTLGR